VTREREIVVVGGGPGGLSAALAAARAGAQVTLIDGYARSGGQYYRQPPERFMAQANQRQRQGRDLAQQVREAGVEICPETIVWNLDDQKRLSTASPRGAGTLSAKVVILATGTVERLAAFPGWTLPGVISAGAAQTLLYQHVLPGRRVLVAGTGPLLLVTGAELLEAGAQVAAVLEGARVLRRGTAHALSAWGQWERLAEGAHSLWTLARHGVPYRAGWGILAAHGTERVEGATIARLDADWRPIPGSEVEIACDTICAGWGFVPFNALSRLAGVQQEWRAEWGGEAPARDEHMQTSLPGLYAAGDGAGIGGYRMALLEGQIAGAAAAASLGHDDQRAERLIRRLRPALRRERAFQRLYAGVFTPGPGAFELAQPDTLVCRCESVRMAQLEEAVRAGADSLIELKALTRCGMGECQGRMCGPTIIPWLAQVTGRSPAEIGVYPPRPPVFPLPLGWLAREEEEEGGERN
jgi:NADPH-dependent 2,4-dienoyl-CoA reductase/sulfur reductase-like enzyme